MECVVRINGKPYDVSWGECKALERGSIPDRFKYLGQIVRKLDEKGFAFCVYYEAFDEIFLSVLLNGDTYER